MGTHKGADPSAEVMVIMWRDFFTSCGVSSSMFPLLFTVLEHVDNFESHLGLKNYSKEKNDLEI